MKSLSVRIAALAAAGLWTLVPGTAAAESFPPVVRIAIPETASPVRVAESDSLRLSEGSAAASTGFGVLMPVIGRLVGSGNTLFKTSLDVSNFSSSSATVGFLFHGADLRTSAAISFSGRFANDGGTLERAFSSIHYDDFIDAMVQKGSITSDQESDGILGSLLIVFGDIPASGQGAARARFYSGQFGGTIGVAVNGHEFNRSETTALAGAFSDTRTISGTPQLYSNIFINNIGVYEPITGQFFKADDIVRISAFSATTGQPIGTPLAVPIATFQTISTGLSALGVPPGSGEVVVLARATKGAGLLLGVGAEVDDTTKDPSGFAMSPVPFSSTGPTPTGDLASQIAGNGTGTWNNATFQSTGSAVLSIATSTSAKTFRRR